MHELEMTVSSLLKVKTENRGTLYYNKYMYRGTFYLYGVRRTSNARNMLDYLKSLKCYVEDSQYWSGINKQRVQKEIDAIDLNLIEGYLDWRETNSDKITVRIESDKVSIFSNDLALLKTLEKFGTVEYSQVDVSIPKGVMYFVKEPKYKNRIYLKSKAVIPTFHSDLSEFIDRYSKTTTVIVPSTGLQYWLHSASRNTWWGNRYTNSSFFIDYNDESSFTLISLFFHEMLGKHFKLEKRPE